VKLGIVYIARALALLWAGFWVLFFVGSAWVWHTPVHVLVSGAAVLLLFTIVALVPWRREGIGGLLLVVIGLLVGAVYAIWPPPQLPLLQRVITIVVFLTGPPLVAGILFLMHHRAGGDAAGAIHLVRPSGGNRR